VLGIWFITPPTNNRRIGRIRPTRIIQQKYQKNNLICYNTIKKGKCMLAVKQEAQEMIQNLPNNCTYEDIQYHLYVVEKIKNGISRANNNEVSSHQNAKERMAKWLSN